MVAGQFPDCLPGRGGHRSRVVPGSRRVSAASPPSAASS